MVLVTIKSLLLLVVVVAAMITILTTSSCCFFQLYNDVPFTDMATIIQVVTNNYLQLLQVPAERRSQKLKTATTTSSSSSSSTAVPKVTTIVVIKQNNTTVTKDNRTTGINNNSMTNLQQPRQQHLLSILCKKQCSSTNKHDCTQYKTPLNTCYNGQVLFPNDPTWGNITIYDTVVVVKKSENNNNNNNNKSKIVSTKQVLKRYFLDCYDCFQNNCNNNNNNRSITSITTTANNTLTFKKIKCNSSIIPIQPTDVYTLPLGVCIGPFGKPRPWGTLYIVS